MQTAQKLGKVGIVLDSRLVRERTKMLLSKINALRHDCEVRTLRGDLPDDDVLELIKKSKFDLVIVPWYRYLEWRKLEAHFGLGRTSGPTVAGYLPEPIPVEKLPEARPDLNRLIILDFVHSSNTELRKMVTSLVQDKRRTGLLSMLEKGTTVYTDHWHSRVNIGEVMDIILELKEIDEHHWHLRAVEIRMALLALWNLIYEEGPGKGILMNTSAGTHPKAFFQLGMDSSMMLFRLCFKTGGWRLKEAITSFWPAHQTAISGIPLLARYTDLVRIHTIAETPGLEIVAGLTKSAPSRNHPQHLYNIWIEPIAENLLNENPTEAPGPKHPHLKLLPSHTQPHFLAEKDQEKANSRDRLLVKANSQMQELKNLIAEKEETIRELKMGGLGAPQKMTPPDTESLLVAFKERYAEMKHLIRQHELELSLLRQRGATEMEILPAEKKLKELVDQEKRLSKLLEEINSPLPLPKGA